MRHAVPQNPVTEACVPNIGARGRTRRAVASLGWSLVTVAIFATLALKDAATTMFLVVAPFTALASVYFFQVREKT